MPTAFGGEARGHVRQMTLSPWNSHRKILHCPWRDAIPSSRTAPVTTLRARFTGRTEDGSIRGDAGPFAVVPPIDPSVLAIVDGNTTCMAGGTVTPTGCWDTLGGPVRMVRPLCTRSVGATCQEAFVRN